MSQTIIITPRLKLRQWKEKDVEPFIKMNMDKEVMRFFPSVQTTDETIAQVGWVRRSN